MKTLPMLTVGLMPAGCGSMENYVPNQGVASTPLRDRGNVILGPVSPNGSESRSKPLNNPMSCSDS